MGRVNISGNGCPNGCKEDTFTAYSTNPKVAFKDGIGFRSTCVNCGLATDSKKFLDDVCRDSKTRGAS